jgi:hypothetical protein
MEGMEAVRYLTGHESFFRCAMAEKNGLRIRAMRMGAHSHGPRCDRCGGSSGRAVRTRMLVEQADPVYYLAYMWACTVCGKSWIDDALERINAATEKDTRIAACGARMMPRKAS